MHKLGAAAGDGAGHDLRTSYVTESHWHRLHTANSLRRGSPTAQERERDSQALNMNKKKMDALVRNNIWILTLSWHWRTPRSATSEKGKPQMTGEGKEGDREGEGEGHVDGAASRSRKYFR